MRRIAPLRIGFAIFIVSLLSGLVLIAQEAKDAPPMPAPFARATKVFISNAGVDGMSQESFERHGDPQLVYYRFYEAMRGWGRYKLVNDPGEANLVFQICFRAPVGKWDYYEPQIAVTVLDAKTHFTLWTVVRGTNSAVPRPKRIDQTIARVIDDLKKLAGEAPSTATNAQK